MRIPNLRMGTRGSLLARAQSRLVQDLLRAIYPTLDISEHIIQTTGDKIQDRPLAEIGGKSLFTKEIQNALQEKSIDVAVHSLKDLEDIPEGHCLAAILKREDPRDILLSPQNYSLKTLPLGATLGTCSPRRSLQVKAIRPDLTILPLRGNIDTRLRKLAEGQFDAIILAVAGLKRLGISYEGVILDEFLPAVGQGALVLETRLDDQDTLELLKPLHDKDTALCVNLERALLKHLSGNCFTPIAGLATLSGQDVTLEGLYAPTLEHKPRRAIKCAPKNSCENLAFLVAQELTHDPL